MHSIKVYKQYFNFASSHFLVFADGTREPLHGHNYRVSVRGDAPSLVHDMVFDFLNIKPLVKEICDSLDHKCLIPAENQLIKFVENRNNIELTCPDGSFFSFPKQDILMLPMPNLSAEHLAIYVGKSLQCLVTERFNFCFSNLEIEVEETPGQSAIVNLRN